MKRSLLILGGVIILTLTAWLIVQSKITPVELIAVEQQDINKLIRETGYVELINGYTIEAAQSGKIIAVVVETGQNVKTGEKLIHLENLDLDIEYASIASSENRIKAQLDAGEITLQSMQLELLLAQQDFERKALLYEQNAIAKVDYETSQLLASNLQKSLGLQKSYVAQSQAELDNIRARNDELTKKRAQLFINSPIDGIVFDLPVEIGKVVALGEVLAQLGKTENLEIKADILSSDLSQVALGQKVYISLPEDNNKYVVGQISKIFPRAYIKQSSLGIEQRRVPVTIALNDVAHFRPGYEVQIAIETASKEQALVLPRESVRTEANGTNMVWLVKNNRAEFTPVETGIKNSTSIEITAGVTAGDMVVRNAASDLKNLQKIKVLN